MEAMLRSLFVKIDSVSPDLCLLDYHHFSRPLQSFWSLLEPCVTFTSLLRSAIRRIKKDLSFFLAFQVWTDGDQQPILSYS